MREVFAGGPKEAFVRLVTEDPEHVDLAEVLPQVEALARAIRPGAVLVHVLAHEVVGGTVDATKRGAIFELEYEGFDRSQPPGKDRIQTSVRVFFRDGRLFAWSHAGISGTLRRDLDGKPLAPPCSSRRAWAAAVNSGVPDNAVVRLDYEAAVVFDAPTVGGSLPRRRQWTLTVAGHEELSRALDPVTCEVFPPPKKPSAKPAGSTRRPTPCAPPIYFLPAERQKKCDS